MAPIPYDSPKSNSLPLRVEFGKGVGKALLTGAVDCGQSDRVNICFPSPACAFPSQWPLDL